jgi:hypothetical protein
MTTDVTEECLSSTSQSTEYRLKLHHHHHSEHGRGLGLKICSFEAQGVPGPSILLSVFPYPAIPEVGTGRPASVSGFYPFVPGGLPISFDTV